MPAGLEEIVAGLYRCTSGLNGPQQPVNSYVWLSDAGTVLVDPAEDLTPELLSEIGAPPVADILITHLQRENAQGCFNFPGARVHVPAGDEYLAEGAEAYSGVIKPWQPPWEWEIRGNYHGNVAGTPNERPTNNPLPLDASLEPGPNMLGCRVVSTPGHGKSAVTLIASIAGTKVAFCGDLVCGEGKLWNWFDSEWDYGLRHGQWALMKSARLLRMEGADILCPTHGPVVNEPDDALDALSRRLSEILRPSPDAKSFDGMVPDKDSPAPGFREILPNLHQWKMDGGNCNVLVSESGGALMVDDGLCFWEPLPERAAHHRCAIAALKQALGIKKIEIVIPSHYHGDHTENIPELVEMEGTQVLSLDVVAEPIEHPERFRIMCLLPWYGAAHDTITVDRKVTDGERVQWREFELEIFHLGGQTCYAQGVTVDIGGVRTLFVGDSFGGADTNCEPVMCYNGTPYEHGWAAASERMRERRPDLIVSGHGGAMRNPMPLLEEQCAAWRRRMRQFAQLSLRPDLKLFFDPFV
jgi:glyoxylase-like metal-dependent hydrolase (beta-lactamase superfamily II)